MNLIAWLTDRSMGSPGPAGDWPTWLSVLFPAANLVIGLADLAIPLIIFANWKYKREGIGRATIWTVLIYFPIKATSRFLRVTELFGPAYHATVIFDGLTAILSLYVDSRLGPFLRHVMMLPSRDEVHELNNRLNVELLDKQDRNERLMLALEDAHRALESNVWLSEKHAKLDEIAAIVKERM